MVFVVGNMHFICDETGTWISLVFISPQWLRRTRWPGHVTSVPVLFVTIISGQPGLGRISRVMSNEHLSVTVVSLDFSPLVHAKEWRQVINEVSEGGRIADFKQRRAVRGRNDLRCVALKVLVAVVALHANQSISPGRTFPVHQQVSCYSKKHGQGNTRNLLLILQVR